MGRKVRETPLIPELCPAHTSQGRAGASWVNEVLAGTGSEGADGRCVFLPPELGAGEAEGSSWEVPGHVKQIKPGGQATGHS